MKRSPSQSPRILVLGARGMLGHMVYRTLHERFPRTTWGTARGGRGWLPFEAVRPERSYAEIRKRLRRIDYVVNCIAILPPPRGEVAVARIPEYLQVNAVLPHVLADFAERDGFRLIHISTDAVFLPDAGVVDERRAPSPVGVYGITKLLGEPRSRHALTFRTSVIGLDSRRHRGLLEWVLAHQAEELRGYVNQVWSGCTTPQFADVCRRIIENNLFDDLRSVSGVRHLAPLGPTTKYDLLRATLSLIRMRFRLRKVAGEPVTRRLRSRFDPIVPPRRLDDALRDLFAAEGRHLGGPK